jgi:hypothetical protein
MQVVIALSFVLAAARVMRSPAGDRLRELWRLGMSRIKSAWKVTSKFTVWAAAPVAVAATVVAVPAVLWSFTQWTFGGISDPSALYGYRQSLQRECARWSLWVACAGCGVALAMTLVRAARTRAPGLSAAAAVSLDTVGVLAWSAIVRFVLTEPNILSDGGSAMAACGGTRWEGGRDWGY